LENSGTNQKRRECVVHRIDDLETLLQLQHVYALVVHRIDDLENE
ncbi:hypothetical protein J717_4082, partial [Acinetobacter baumannii 121738]